MPLNCRKMSRQRQPLLKHVLRHFQSQVQPLIQLRSKNDDGNPGGEPGDHRVRNKLQQPTPFQASHDEQDHAGPHRGQGESGMAMRSHHGGQYRHERPRGAPDLKPGTSEG